MSRIVLKFGGTSVANIERLEHVAQKVKQEIAQNNQVVLVVSAMAGITNLLLSYTHALNPNHVTPEHDTVLSSGEQVTSGLLAMALNQIGIPARSFLSWQIPILTDSGFTNARITIIQTEELEACLKEKCVPIIAGFQGLSPQGRLTTLGRGGSDTTAVALAAALKADYCNIYTDVEGVYTADPRLVPKARKLGTITYAEMFEMAAQGAKVLQARSVELAMKHRIPLRVLSSFVDAPGTNVIYERNPMEKALVSGIVHNQDEVKVTLVAVPDEVGMAAQIFGALADERIHIDMIVQNLSREGRADLTFTTQKSDIERAVTLLEDIKEKVGFSDILIDRSIVKISVIGVGMRSNLEIASVLFKTLAEKGINIQLISTSEIKISVIIPHQHTPLAMCALHTAYNLDFDSH